MASQKETVIAKWTEPLTQLLVSLMVDEVKKGNRTTSTFNKAGWNNIQREFNKQTGCQYSMDKFKNRAFKLKKLYGSFKKLLNQTGFGWDNINNKVVVDDETLWETHVKEHTEWATFRKEGFPLYPQLCVVFGDTYATGEFASGNVQDQMSSEDGAGDEFAGSVPLGTPEEVRVQESLSEDGLHNGHQTGQGSDDEPRVTPVPEKHRLNRTPNLKRRRKSTSYEFDRACKAISESLQFRMPQSSHTSVTSQTPQYVDPYSMGAFIAVLKSMPDMEPTLYAKALNHGSMNAAWRESFILTEPEWRRYVLDSI